MADMTFNFNLKPNTTTLDLGDSTNKWQNLYVGTIAATTLQAPTTSGGSTLGVGSSGQFLSSNGTSSYWASLPTASTSAAGIIQIGTGATNACAGNDSRLSNSRTPTAHATTSTTYGGGTASNYGHVALTDTYATVSTSQKAANSIAASAWALQTAYTTLNSNKVDKTQIGDLYCWSTTNLGETNIYMRIKWHNSEQGFFIWGVGAQNTTLCAVIELWAGTSGYNIKNLGSTNITFVAKDSTYVKFKLATWFRGSIMSYQPFEITMQSS